MYVSYVTHQLLQGLECKSVAGSNCGLEKLPKGKGKDTKRPKQLFILRPTKIYLYKLM